MQLTNEKLIERGVRMIRASIAISEKEARDLLLKHGNVQKVLESFPT
jgi:N-acetylmuramic acid 6-phosphate etherase